jgi:hypothetical protein
MSRYLRSTTETFDASRPIRRALVALAVLTGLLVFASNVDAQTPSRAVGALELRPYVGAYIPTGDQRDLLEDAVLVGAQASWRVHPKVAVTGTFGWSPSKDRLNAGDETVDLFQYDIGAEARATSWYVGETWDFTPFVGLGVGGRSYSYRDLDDVDSQTDLAGYGAVGGEVGLGRLGLRLEARDYLSRFEPIVGDGDAETRNDVTVAAGLTVRF